MSVLGKLHIALFMQVHNATSFPQVIGVAATFNRFVFYEKSGIHLISFVLANAKRTLSKLVCPCLQRLQRLSHSVRWSCVKSQPEVL